MTERAYTPEERETARRKLFLNPEWHGPSFDDVTIDLQCALTAAEERVKELEQEHEERDVFSERVDKERDDALDAKEKAEAELSAIRDAPIDLIIECTYCGTDGDHKHANGHGCCGNCCASHGMLTHPNYDHGEYEFVTKIVENKDRLVTVLTRKLAALEAENNRVIEERRLTLNKFAAMEANLVANYECLGCRVPIDFGQSHTCCKQEAASNEIVE